MGKRRGNDASVVDAAACQLVGSDQAQEPWQQWLLFSQGGDAAAHLLQILTCLGAGHAKAIGAGRSRGDGQKFAARLRAQVQPRMAFNELAAHGMIRPIFIDH